MLTVTDIWEDADDESELTEIELELTSADAREETDEKPELTEIELELTNADAREDVEESDPSNLELELTRADDGDGVDDVSESNKVELELTMKSPEELPDDAQLRQFFVEEYGNQTYLVMLLTLQCRTTLEQYRWRTLLASLPLYKIVHFLLGTKDLTKPNFH